MSHQVSVIRIERIWLKSNPVLSRFCHLSKNLFNEANYIIRQSFFSNGTWIKAGELQHQLKDSDNFLQLPIPTALKILQLVERAWKSFLGVLADWKIHSEKYFRKPRPPKYKRKDGEFILPFTKSQLGFANGILTFSQN